MSYRLVSKPKPPFTTVSGKTSGPCVTVGRAVRPGPVYLHVETELRQAVKDAGWPNPETHAELVAKLDAATVELAGARAELDRVTGENETLRAALHALKQPKPAAAVVNETMSGGTVVAVPSDGKTSGGLFRKQKAVEA